MFTMKKKFEFSSNRLFYLKPVSLPIMRKKPGSYLEVTPHIVHFISYPCIFFSQNIFFDNTSLIKIEIERELEPSLMVKLAR